MATQLRMPCYKLNLRFGRDGMIQRFFASRRCGFYFSVVEQGDLQAGSKIEVIHRDPARVSVADVLGLYVGGPCDSALPGAGDEAANPT